MKTILCIEASVDATFEYFLVRVEDDHPAVDFFERWQKTGKAAWIDMSSEDDAKLIDMWQKLEMQKTVFSFPCTIDGIIYAWYD